MDNQKVTEKTTTALSTQEQESLLKENMAGIENPEFPNIDILHAGALSFQTDEESMREFSGQILLYQRVNAHWVQGYDETGGGVPPDCASLDAVIGKELAQSDNFEDEGKRCDTCEYNQMTVKGKACKNMIRVFMRREGDLLPSVLVVPPTSIRPFNAYAVKLTQKGLPFLAVNTLFTLEAATNKQGIKYSRLSCRIGNSLEGVVLREGFNMRKTFEKAMRQKPIFEVEKEEE